MDLKLPNDFEQLVNFFGKLPSIGEKTAQRLVLSLMKWNHQEITEFSKSLSQIQSIKRCNLCGMFASDLLCDVCLDEKRYAAKSICVIESVTDFMAVEKSGYFKGVYHILGGVINPLLGIGPENLKIDILKQRVREKGIKEVILALNPSVEGDVTCSYIKQELGEDIAVHRIGFGVPMGANLEYMDSLTISKAMEFRRSF
jgi:recombination protein RecR